MWLRSWTPDYPAVNYACIDSSGEIIGVLQIAERIDIDLETNRAQPALTIAVRSFSLGVALKEQSYEIRVVEAQHTLTGSDASIHIGLPAVVAQLTPIIETRPARLAE